MIHRYHGTNEAMIQLGHHTPVYAEKSWESLQVPLLRDYNKFFFFSGIPGYGKTESFEMN